MLSELVLGPFITFARRLPRCTRVACSACSFDQFRGLLLQIVRGHALVRLRSRSPEADGARRGIMSRTMPAGRSFNLLLLLM
ncbi:hypothetical protein CO669_32505 [Bradyrhizobium sp. Y36]|nr:hypothetical protein CO669_34045 [Bradyrhizobium sp. Y36]PDT84048.1 hypothetical protein CO669_32505 [Bradyrhizobium sp. Y36]